MRLRVVGIIFCKEFREALRDRRTLFMMVALPTLLYPLLLIGMSKLMEGQEAEQSAKGSRVAVWGTQPGSLEQRLRQSGKLELLPWVGIPGALRTRLETGSIAAPPPAPLKLEAGDEQKKAKEPETEVYMAAREVILARKADAVLLLWPGFAGATEAGRMGTVSILFDSVRPESGKARDRVDDALKVFRQDLLAMRERQHGLAPGFATAIDLHSQDIAPESRRAGQVFGALLPYLLIVFSLMSGFYAAIDVTAGEKERGTMQTLLCAPLESLEIIAGKFCAVWSIAMVATVVNLLSLSLTLSRIKLHGGFTVSVSPVSAAIAFLMLVPILLMVVALFLAIGVFAKDFKEGQNFLTPLLMTLMMPGAVSMIPGIELNGYLVFVPIVNIVLFIKAVFIGEWHADQLFLVLLSSFCYAALALLLASRVFEQNNLLLGGKEKIGSVLDFSRRPGARPTPGVSVLIFAIVLVIAFYGSLALENAGFAVMLGVMEFGFFLLPALLTIAAKGYPLAPTLSLRMPAWQGLAGGFVVGVSGWVAAMLTLRILPPPESLTKALERVLLLQDKAQPLWLILLMAAVAPALCEEVFFRGLILSGFRRLGMWPAIVATGFLFSLAHASIYRMMPTMLLGVVFGYAAWQTRSIVPAIVAHALNNGLMLSMARSPRAMEWLGLAGARQMPLWMVAAGCVVLAGGMLLLRSAGAAGDALDSPPGESQYNRTL